MRGTLKFAGPVPSVPDPRHHIPSSHFPFYPVYCIPLYPCTLYTVYCTHYTLDIIPSSHFPWYPVYRIPLYPCTLYTVYCTLYTVYQYTVYKCPVYQYIVYLSTLLPITKGISTHYQGYMCPLQRVYVPSIIVYWYTCLLYTSPSPRDRG